MFRGTRLVAVWGVALCIVASAALLPVVTAGLPWPADESYKDYETAPIPGVTVGVRVKAKKPMDIPVCEPVRIVYTLRNRSPNRLMLPDTFLLRDFLFDVRDSKNRRAELTAYGRNVMRNIRNGDFFHAGVYRVDPGTELEQTVLLNLYFDMTRGGKFTISAKRFVLVNGKARWVPLETVSVSVSNRRNLPKVTRLAEQEDER